ncbi:MAG: RIP metalloprotease RseP [Muribaculaceae bacterium]|nr:RIP metalloprotease RseP [Muribaculaceae bacterium]
METALIKALQLIAALSLLVIVHEFGHYMFARIFGMRVNRFYLFFNYKFSLLKYLPREGKILLLSSDDDKAAVTLKVGRRHPENEDRPGKSSWRDTVYGIGWIPLGGYCQIAGMIDETQDLKSLSAVAEPWEFRAKPAYQRLLVMLGGVIMNFVLAVIIYAGIAFYWGESRISFRDVSEGFDFVPAAQSAGFRNGDIPVVADGRDIGGSSSLMDIIEAREVKVLRNGTDTVTIALPEDFIFNVSDAGGFMAMRVPVIVKSLSAGDPAIKAGVMEGDRFIAVDTVATPAYTEFSRVLLDRAGMPTEFTVERDGQIVKLEATPTSDGKLGIGLMLPAEIYPVQYVRYGLLESIPKGISNGTATMANYVGSLKYVFTKRGAESIGGFGAIGSMFPSAWNWLTFWETVAFLSIILAFMNVIPIPALDGGHVMFLIWEMITGRKPSDKFLEYAQMAGMFFLLALLLYANGNDLYRFFIK